MCVNGQLNTPRGENHGGPVASKIEHQSVTLPPSAPIAPH